MIAERHPTGPAPTTTAFRRLEGNCEGMEVESEIFGNMRNHQTKTYAKAPVRDCVYHHAFAIDISQ